MPSSTRLGMKWQAGFVGSKDYLIITSTVFLNHLSLFNSRRSFRVFIVPGDPYVLLFLSEYCLPLHEFLKS